VFALVQPDRDVQKLTDLSCLGHFETCKALANLLNCGYLQALAPEHRLPGLGTEGRWVDRLSTTWMRVGLATIGFAGLALVASQLSLPGIRLRSSATSADADRAIQRFVARAQLSRIASALEVYRSETGRLPDKLEPLVDLHLLRSVDLHYPWHENYYYRQISDQEFILLPPLR
jgi:hypothetical protein